ncbi:MAG: dTMP kinase [Syntrophobacterales bacterium GWC2_56_13]|nr:MAG: dTMP kinase [Syntrophobacterales bacterium GWC2_56_13]OHE19998.1 MAG: dTMP kinase [Syntrophobacterales bacterium GWF2_56_9]
MTRFVTFEGIEGCGKTTQIRLAAAWLAERGIPVLATAEPGGTPLGRKIREILLNRSSCAIGAEAELLLFAAARAQHVRETILPALEEGQWVLCDRFADATLAYQGFGRGLDAAFIRTLNDFSTCSLKPDLTLLFDLPVEAGLARAKKRTAGTRAQKAEDRFEREEKAFYRKIKDRHHTQLLLPSLGRYWFHERIRDGYLNLAAGEPERFRIIDGAADVETVHREVCLRLAELL